MINPFDYRKGLTYTWLDFWGNIDQKSKTEISIKCRNSTEKIQLNRGWIGVYLLENDYAYIESDDYFTGLSSGSYGFNFKFDPEEDWNTFSFDAEVDYSSGDIDTFLADINQQAIDQGNNTLIQFTKEEYSPENKIRIISVDRGDVAFYIEPLDIDDLLVQIGYNDDYYENITKRATYYEWLESDPRVGKYENRYIVPDWTTYEIIIDIENENTFIGTTRKPNGMYIITIYYDTSTLMPTFKLAECVDQKQMQVWIENNKLIGEYEKYNVLTYLIQLDQNKEIAVVTNTGKPRSVNTNSLTVQTLYDMILYDRKRININSNAMRDL